MKHIVSASGGMASFATSCLVAEKHGIENVILAFCDTLIEDEDLYRFLVEGAAALVGKTVSPLLAELVRKIPPVHSDTRPAYLETLASIAMVELPHLVWLRDGRDPWGIYAKERYMGNTRIAPCTVALKGKTFARWLSGAFQSHECVLYFGFDWAEEHRLADVRKNWAPYTCEAPLCAPPYLSRAQVNQFADDHDIDAPRMYAEGFAHNNCGGFCPRAGQAHYANLLVQRPAVYAHHEGKQEALKAALPTFKPFLRMTIDRQLNYLTMKEFRQLLEGGGQHDEFEHGGCGCFSDGSAEGIAALIANDNAQPDEAAA